MGILRVIKNYEEDQLHELNINYKGLNWLELGNQDFEGKPAKVVYQEQGVIHTSIDLNGSDEALPLDLSQPISLKKKFDVITNYGTSEHVNDQYECFKNIHNLSKKGGVIIHGVPLIGNWRKHGRYHYSEEFFSQLASACKYEIQSLQILDKDHYSSSKNLIIVTFVNKKGGSFISKEKFESLGGLLDSGYMKNTQNYTK